MSYENLRFRRPDDLKVAGYDQLAGPYFRKDAGMFNNLMADATKANRTVAFSGDHTRVEVWQKRR